MSTLTLVLGGTRSGKSALAEGIAAAAGEPVRCLVFGEPVDSEIEERIAAHRARRPARWEVMEAPDVLAAARHDGPLLLDSLGSWLTAALARDGLLADPPRPRLSAALERWLCDVEALGELARGRRTATVVVAEEAGLGPTPPSALTRRWLDALGDAKQRLAGQAGEVVLAVAGRALRLPETGSSAADARLAVHGDRLVPEGARDYAVNVEPRPAWLDVPLAAALAGCDAYPDDGAAREALAELHGRHPGEVLPLNGAAEGPWLLAAVLLPRHAACVHPGFTEPERALRSHGTRVTRVLRDPRAGWALEPEAVPEDADLVALCNPNNPTGTLDAAGVVARLARPGRTLLVDEAFMPFCRDRESLAGRTDLPGLAVLRSVTKHLGVPGLRAGYLLAAKALVERLVAVRPPWPVNRLALAALEAAAPRHRADVAALAADTARRRERLLAALGRLPGVTAWPSAANFVLVRVPNGAAVERELRARGVAVRTAATFPGLTTDHLRLSVRDEVACDALASALEEALCASA